MTSANTTFNSSKFGEVTVKDKLGEGGQGSVFRVSTTSGEFALKWYKPEIVALPGFRSAIEHLVDMGPPNDPVGSGKRFLWPLDLITDNGNRFGYLMELLSSEFCNFSKIRNTHDQRYQEPSFSNLCHMSFLMAHSFRALHSKGYCYKDISVQNIAVNPGSGEILIMDNDNVSTKDHNHSRVGGTLPFMAPEVALGHQNPSTLSDLHSLAILLFYFWMNHHPFSGQIEYDLPIITPVEQIELFHKNPVFIFDPNDTRNRPPSAYVNVMHRWEACPVSLKQLFIKAFAVGTKDQNQRITEGAWRSLFLKLKAGVFDCPKCNAEVILDLEDVSACCWNCKEPLPRPARLKFENKNFSHEIPLIRTTKIYPYHLSPKDNASYEKTDQLIGEMVPHPTIPNKWGIRNKTKNTWDVRLNTGEVHQIPPEKSLAVSSSVKEVFIETTTMTIIRNA